MSESVDALLDQLDEQVGTALRTLFPAAEAGVAPKDAQQRAQDFASQVAAVHARLAEIKATVGELPATPDTPAAALEKEVADLRTDIQAKDAALAKYRQILGGHIERLRAIDAENRACIDGM
ncbi:hypothetical protein IWQ57_000815 [Coemansia nantahalensis]|uniref:Uncharacterized protein n=1 Tax=Coemansia nantahalensis TaxID=2789366 RepID=A0ACC1K6A3_9FUNG|nr:hypothetical protein IWQ57_000815 [Coemansia nantahalensis]